MAWYKTGTVSVVNGQTSITGTGTKFATNSRVGDGFRGPDGQWYEITNIASETTISIYPSYQSGTVSNTTAYMIAPIQGYNKESADRLRAITDSLTVVTSVAGKTGAVSLNKSDVGLNNVDNTSDINKPISNAQAAAINAKEPNISNGTTGQYWNGLKQWTDFGATTRSTTLTGYTLGSASAVTVADSILTGFGKVQGQLNVKAGSGANTDITSLMGLNYARVSNSANPANNPGMYLLWNSGGGGLSGSGDFICNQGAGHGGFTWRTINLANTSTGPTMVYMQDGTLRIPLGPIPFDDGAANCGRSTARWATVFAVTGTINTSDAREKTAVQALKESELQAAMVLAKEIGSYKWLEAVVEKGEDARSHIGMTVQRAIEIMEDHDLEPLTYAFICYDEWPEEPEVVKEEIYGRIYSAGELYSDHAKYEEFLSFNGMPSFTWEETSRETIVIKEYKPAGNRYGFRNDQLALFIARGQEERLSRLEALMNN